MKKKTETENGPKFGMAKVMLRKFTIGNSCYKIHTFWLSHSVTMVRLNKVLRYLGYRMYLVRNLKSKLSNDCHTYLKPRFAVYADAIRKKLVGKEQLTS